ncbi:MAG: 30S ribosome-binding factor RbfA [Flavobacteriales bacterium]|nr:30S ribosome-binding factor RbfA [Flavobacteriales bacterium]
MESTRQLKVARLIQKVISQILIKEGSGIYGHMMVSVTMVRISPDLSVAKIYLSIFGAASPKQVIESLNKHKPHIRFLLGAELKKQLRIIPELIFYYDDSAEYAEKIDRLFDEMHHKQDSEEDNHADRQDT